jgi:general secretion pathway protein F
MGAFEYTAVDPRGKELKGVMEGDTPRRVRQLLRDRDLLPLSVTEIAEKESTRQQSFTIRRTLSANDLALITRQIATLVHSGLPVEEALVAVGEQSDIPRIKSIILGVRAKVMEGHTRRSRPVNNPAIWIKCWNVWLITPKAARNSNKQFSRQ